MGRKSESIIITGAPADLHPLMGLDTIVVKKKVTTIINSSSLYHIIHHQIEMVEVVLGCETKNRYHIFDSQVSSLLEISQWRKYSFRFFISDV